MDHLTYTTVAGCATFTIARLTGCIWSSTTLHDRRRQILPDGRDVVNSWAVPRHAPRSIRLKYDAEFTPRK
jgi:hypothetical protein